jgi:hypothetical protein
LQNHLGFAVVTDVDVDFEIEFRSVRLLQEFKKSAERFPKRS